MTSCCNGVEVEKEGGCDEKMVTWERLMPRMSLRMLLVESDESTRQVIAALLRKCSYKVAAVSDGLTAWEVLKGKPNSIDLILMEMELPSISGFALLTLIMEHDSCKNIPVIMMSKNDSVNMVYKCMLRGAADFLVKPVRKNELQNLWQHVWRRQACASVGKVMPDESITQHKAEGLLDNITQHKAERLLDNDLLIDESNVGCTPENEECIEKGNDAQSSCSVPDIVGVKMIQQEDPVCKKVQGGTLAEASGSNDAFINGSREAIDLIGTFQNHSTKSCIKSSEINENDSCPQLDLSLRRCDDSRGITVDARRNVVHQSNASAFSRYKASKPSTQRECEGSSSRQMTSPVLPSNFHNNNCQLNSRMSSVYHENSDLRRGELPFSCPQSTMYPVKVQVKGVRLDGTCTSYGSSLCPSYYKHTGASLTPIPDSVDQREVLSRVPDLDRNISSCSNQMAQRQELNPGNTEHMEKPPYVNERSQNSSACNGVISHLNSFGGGSVCGSNSGSNPFEGSTLDENKNRSLQREAALYKFRLKRKDRCFEKKVRYESRKKLAEQRPRVKGQFVRQTPTADL